MLPNMYNQFEEYINKHISLDYNNYILIWKSIPNNNKRAIINNPVGSMDTKGYRRVTINGREIKCHIIIWYIHYNKWPDDFIDHINGNTLDNSISNLREASCRINGQNQVRHRNGHLVGANYRKDIKKWRSRVSINSKQYTIGNFNTELEAHLAYIKYCKDNNLD